MVFPYLQHGRRRHARKEGQRQVLVIGFLFFEAPGVSCCQPTIGIWAPRRTIDATTSEKTGQFKVRQQRCPCLTGRGTTYSLLGIFETPVWDGLVCKRFWTLSLEWTLGPRRMHLGVGWNVIASSYRCLDKKIYSERSWLFWTLFPLTRLVFMLEKHIGLHGGVKRAEYMWRVSNS